MHHRKVDIETENQATANWQKDPPSSPNQRTVHKKSDDRQTGRRVPCPRVCGTIQQKKSPNIPRLITAQQIKLGAQLEIAGVFATFYIADF
jgi:hypothetical protein